MINYSMAYDILGIPYGSNLDVIEKAFDKKVHLHMDDAFNVTEAYRYLATRSGIQILELYEQLDSNSRKLLKKALNQYNSHNYKAACTVINKALSAETNKDYLLFAKAKVQCEARHYKAASTTLQELYQKYPENIFVLELISLFGGKGISENWIDSARRAFMEENSSFLLLTFFSNMHDEEGSMNEMIKLLEQSLTNKTYYIWHWLINLRLAQAYAEIKSKAKSQECINRAINYIDGLSFVEDYIVQSLVDFTVNFVLLFEPKQAYSLASFLEHLESSQEHTIETPFVFNFSFVTITSFLRTIKQIISAMNDKKVNVSVLAFIIRQFIEKYDPDEEESPLDLEMSNFTSEYYFLLNSTTNISTLKYLKRNYPEIYDIKKEFFDSIIDANKRLKLKKEYDAKFTQYEDEILKYSYKKIENYNTSMHNSHDNDNKKTEEKNKNKAEQSKIIPFRKK